LNREDNQYQEKLLKISRVSKTTKGGRTISFSVLAATGVIAGSASREILELVGVHDILTKIKGSRNKHNVARATVEALKLLRTAEEIAALRGLEVKDILS